MVWDTHANWFAPRATGRRSATTGALAHYRLKSRHDGVRQHAVVMCAAAVALIAWTGFAFARMNAGQESPAMEISMAVPYAALVAGGVLMALQLALSRLGGTPIPLSEGEDASV